MAKDPTMVAQKWAQNLAGATASIQAGVEAVTTSPGQLAARQKNVYVQQVTANQDKWAAKVAAVSTSDWQQATISKGIPRIATGASAAQPKFANFMQRLLPFQEQLRNSLPPRGTTEQNIQRMVSFVQGMTKFSNR